MFELNTATNGTVTELQDMPVLPETLPAALAGLSEEIRAAILDNNPTAATVETYATNGSTTKPVSRKFLLTLGRSEDWTPVHTADATHKIGSAAGKRSEYDGILSAACAVRGGTVAAIPFGYKVDSMGFRQPDYRPIVTGLERAFFRVADDNDARRIDRAFRVLANDVNAADQKDVAGYILVRVKGYRVK